MEFSLLACICFHMLYATITLRLETNEVRCNTPAATDSAPLPALALNLSLTPNAQSIPKLPLPLRSRQLYSILDLHGQQTLLSQQYLIEECEHAQPNDRGDVHPKGRRDGTANQLEQGFRRPYRQGERKFVEIRRRVPRYDDPAQHGEGKYVEERTEDVGQGLDPGFGLGEEEGGGLDGVDVHVCGGGHVGYGEDIQAGGGDGGSSRCGGDKGSAS